MATKPSVLPQWNTDGTNRTTPSGGQKASGWTLNQAAVSSYFNWLFFYIYSWLLYLSDGALSGPHTIAGTLGVTGNTTVTGTFGVTGNSTIAGTFGVTGNTTITGTLGVSALITASLGITLAVDKHVTVSGDGRYLHGDRYLSLPIIGGAPDAGGNAIHGGSDPYYTTGGSAPWSRTIAIPLPAGKRIKTLTLFYNNASNNSVSGKLIRVETDGDKFDVTNGGISSPASTGNLNTSTSGLDHTCVSSECLMFYVQGTHTTSRAYWLRVIYDEPAP